MVMVVSISIMGISGVFFDRKHETDSNVNNMNCSFVINRHGHPCAPSVLIGIAARERTTKINHRSRVSIKQSTPTTGRQPCEATWCHLAAWRNPDCPLSNSREQSQPSIAMNPSESVLPAIPHEPKNRNTKARTHSLSFAFTWLRLATSTVQSALVRIGFSINNFCLPFPTGFCGLFATHSDIRRIQES